MTTTPGSHATFVDILRARARERPNERAYTFLRDGEDEAATLTFAELQQMAASAAGRLVSIAAAGDRAILLYPQSLDFLVAFFGCLQAGLIPVPVSLPSRQRGMDVLRAVAFDSKAT